MWPAPLNEALWGEYQEQRKVLYCNKPYFLHILMQKWLLCEIPVKSYTMLNCTISFKRNFQRHGLSKIVIYVYFYGPIKNKMFHNTLYFHIFIEKSVCDDWAWYDEYLQKIYIKNENFWPWLIFCPITQNQFYRKEPHLVMLGQKYKQIPTLLISKMTSTKEMLVYLVALWRPSNMKRKHQLKSSGPVQPWSSWARRTWKGWRFVNRGRMVWHRKTGTDI